MMATFQPFSLNDVENEAYGKFKTKHCKKCKSMTQIAFSETGIGVNVKVMCENCGKIKDITDYSSW